MSEHTPGPWMWMDIVAAVPNPENDGSIGVDGLFRAIEGLDELMTKVLGSRYVADIGVCYSSLSGHYVASVVPSDEAETTVSHGPTPLAALEAACRAALKEGGE